MIARDGELKIVHVMYELTDNMGKTIQSEMKVGILATNPQEALQELRKVINPSAKIAINQIADGGCIHIITDNIVNTLTNKTKTTKAVESNNANTKHRGRPKGSPNKPKVNKE